MTKQAFTSNRPRGPETYSGVSGGSGGHRVKWLSVVSLFILTLVMTYAYQFLIGTEIQPKPIRPLTAPLPKAFSFIKGMTISCDRIGPGEWDGPDMPGTLKELDGLGFNGFAIHPYARIENNGLVRDRLKGPNENATRIPLMLAARQNQCVLLKPHLAYWGSQFSWRGEIKFGTQEEEKRFFDSYTDWITSMAAIAAPFEKKKPGSVIFCIGTELDQLTQTAFQRAQWLAIIQKIRAIFPGNLTYAANFDGVDKVPYKGFWDQMDMIGIQSYFPVSTKAVPTDEHLQKGWQAIMKKLHRYSQLSGRPILLTEVGYANSTRAASHPWEDGLKQSLEEKLAGQKLKHRLLKTALTSLAAQEQSKDKDGKWLKGYFIWKWFPVAEGIVREEEFLVQSVALKKLFQETLAK